MFHLLKAVTLPRNVSRNAAGNEFHSMKQSTMQDLLSLKDAASLVGVSKVTLWRAVQKGELEAFQDEKNRYTVSRESVLRWQEMFHPQTREAQGSNSEGETRQETIHNASNDWRNDTQSFRRNSESPTYETVEMVPADLHRVALETARHALEAARKAEERAERAERYREALTGQLAQYQHVLTERAESLQKSEAEAKQAQMLASENSQRLAEFEREHEELRNQLQLSRARVEWLEKRVPRWVRRCFGVG